MKVMVYVIVIYGKANLMRKLRTKEKTHELISVRTENFVELVLSESKRKTKIYGKKELYHQVPVEQLWSH